FELAPVLSQLFKSQHFFDDTTIGVIIKSPYDLYLNLLKETDFSYNDASIEGVIGAANIMGQRGFNLFK
ncbi:MAG: DUF1800 domain-containing protein, partial [Symploca sp. SIO1C4]|nr:DUF1800 domain-containing protein [Symploca sp. SIO1C4]